MDTINTQASSTFARIEQLSNDRSQSQLQRERLQTSLPRDSGVETDRVTLSTLDGRSRPVSGSNQSQSTLIYSDLAQLQARTNIPSVFGSSTSGNPSALNAASNFSQQSDQRNRTISESDNRISVERRNPAVNAFEQISNFDDAPSIIDVSV